MVERKKLARKVREESSSSQNDNFFIQNISERGSAVEIKITDSSPFFILPEDYIEAGIKSGDEISPAEYETLEFLDEKRSAVKKVSRFIIYIFSDRIYAKNKTYEKRISSEASASAAAYLKNKNLVDDRKYAQQWAALRLKKNPSGPYVLKGMLSSKGVDRETAESVVKELFTEEAAEEAVLRQVEKLRRNKSNSDDKIN